MDITNHVLERFREKHPEADRRMVRDYYFDGFEIDAKTASTLGVSARRTATSYVVASDYSGLFVQQGLTLVTFLRFEAEQRHQCEDLFGS